MLSAYKDQPNLDSQRRVEAYRQLLRREARIGGNVFGTVSSDRRREFLCLDEHTWLWHEEWRESSGRLHTVTTRYDIRPRSIVKFQNGHAQKVSAEEALNLLQAARNYQQHVRDLYA